MNHEKSCKDWQNLMVEAFGDELNSQEKAQLESHVQGCAQCLPIWQDYQTLREASHAWETLRSPSISSSERILKFAQSKTPTASTKLKTASPSTKKSWFLNPSLIAFATLTLAVGFSFFAYQMKDRQLAPTMTQPMMAPVELPKKENPSPPPVVDFQQNDESTSAPPPSEKKATGRILSDTIETQTPKRALTPAGSGAKFQEALPRKKQVAPGDRPDGAFSAPEESPSPAEPKSKAGISVEPAPAPTKPSPSTPSEPHSLEGSFGKDKKEDSADELGTGFDSLKENKKQLKALSSVEGEAGAQLQGKLSESQDALLSSAKTKIKAGQYQAALVDLRKIETLGKNPEVEKLIRFCEEKIQSMSPPAQAR